MQLHGGRFAGCQSSSTNVTIMFTRYSDGRPFSSRTCCSLIHTLLMLRSVLKVGSGALDLRSAGYVGHTGVLRVGGESIATAPSWRAQGEDVFAQARVGPENAMIAVAMDAGRRDEAAEGGEELEGREDEHGATVRRGPRRLVADLADGGLAWRPDGGAPVGAALDAQALEGEWRTGAVSEQRSRPAESEPWMRTEASRLKPPLACQVSMSAMWSSRRPRRWKRRNTRRCSVGWRRWTWSIERCVASWKVTAPPSPSEKTPSRTTT